LTGRGPLADGITQGLIRTLRGAWHRLAGAAREVPVAPGGSAALDDNDPGSAERARLRRRAGVHGQVAIQISEPAWPRPVVSGTRQHEVTGRKTLPPRPRQVRQSALRRFGSQRLRLDGRNP